MTRSDVNDAAEALRTLHRAPGLLVVPNAFDAGSARVIERAGFPTIATSSAAMAWSSGVPDGQQMSRSRALEQHAQVVRSVDVPVSIDFEGGYLDDSSGVKDTVEAVIAAGFAGLNLEDTNFADEDSPLSEPAAHAALIAAARTAAEGIGVSLFIVGRTDLFLREVGPVEGRLDEAVRRLSLYAEAGADCVFAPGVAEEGDIAALAEQVDAPLNVMHTAETPGLVRLEELGAARLTFGSKFYLAAMSTIEAAAVALHGGDLDRLEACVSLSRGARGALAGWGLPGSTGDR